MGKKNQVAFFNILSTVILNGISIFTAPLFSRILGSSSYGVVSTYGTWVTMISIVFTLSVNATFANARVRYPEGEWDAYQSSVMGLGCTAFLLFSSIVLLFSKQVAWLMNLDQMLIPMMLIQSLGNSCLAFVTTRFTFEFKAGRNFVISILTTIMTIALSLLLIPMFPYEYGYRGRILALTIVYGSFGAMACIYVFSRGRVYYNKQYWRFCLPLAIPFVFHCLSDLLLGHSDRLMLKALGTDSMVGLYSLASNFATIIYTIWTALNNTWSPFYYEYMRTNQTEQLQKAAKNYAELYSVLASGFILLQPEVYRVFASEEYWSAASLIPVFVIGHYAVFLSSLCVNYETFRMKTKIMAVGTILAAVLNIALNFLWIGSWGIAGASMATMVSHLVQAGYHHIMARRIGNRGDFPIKAKLLLPGMIMFAGAIILTLFAPQLWYIRWPLGGALGIWELYRMYKRKGIF